MKKSISLTFAFGIIFLFLIQATGTLVESIYILDLLNSKLDEKVVGVLFLFTPLLALPFFRKRPRRLAWILFAGLLLARGLMPFLNTANRLVAAGVASGAAFSLLLLFLAARPKDVTPASLGLCGGAGLGLATGLSALLRTAGHGIEFSLTLMGGWSSWVLGLLLGVTLAFLEWEDAPQITPGNHGPVTLPMLGIYLVITLLYFSFSAPAVIARWTQGNYTLIVGAVSLFSLGWVWLALARPAWINRVTGPILLAWNSVFTLALLATILAQRVSFPSTLQSPPVVVGQPAFWQFIPLLLMVVTFPVLFLDLSWFLRQLKQSAPAPRALAPGILLGGLVLILLIFAHIFTNVWGYIRPVSLPFRNSFWLPYLLLAALITLLAWRLYDDRPFSEPAPSAAQPWPGAIGLAAVFLVTILLARPISPAQPLQAGKTSLVVMTYNTQQFNDAAGEKSFDRQLNLIGRVSPDILALQESDSARISLNNNDYVRYFAEQLGYYAYYGPTPVTGTYGTAILSKYPLENPRAIFMFSDKDETGVAAAEVSISGRRFTIYDVHPDSSDPAMVAFAQTILGLVKENTYVIALGDYNLRDYEEAYQIIAGGLVNAWVSVYPSKISAEGVDMSGKNRIDHIFTSPNLKARNPVYVLPPESATDHPVHWIELVWDQP